MAVVFEHSPHSRALLSGVSIFFVLFPSIATHYLVNFFFPEGKGFESTYICSGTLSIIPFGKICQNIFKSNVHYIHLNLCNKKYQNILNGYTLTKNINIYGKDMCTNTPLHNEYRSALNICSFVESVPTQYMHFSTYFVHIFRCM